MIANVLRQLVDQKRISIKELETITGRGSSTIYRWLGGESQPSVDEMRGILRDVADDEARQTIVAALTSNLPMVVRWIGGEDDGDDTPVASDQQLDGHDVLGRTLLALECVSGLLAEEHEAMRASELTTEMLARVVALMDNAINHLTSGRKMLARYRATDQE